ncbi:MAG: class I SAM-dependent methyltransferase [Bacteroidota bacterium]
MASRLDRFVNARPSRQWVLHALRLYPAVTQTSQAERDALARHATAKTRLAEIGVFQGRTTGVLSAVMDPGGVYFAIDPYPGGGRTGIDFNQRIARREVNRRAAGRVEWVQATGAEAPTHPRLQGEQVDFLFIDGDHRYDGLKADWEAWRDLVAPGGIVGLHDTIGGTFGCQRYMHEVILPDPEFERIEEVDSLTIFQRA